MARLAPSRRLFSPDSWTSVAERVKPCAFTSSSPRRGCREWTCCTAKRTGTRISKDGSRHRCRGRVVPSLGVAENPVAWAGPARSSVSNSPSSAIWDDARLTRTAAYERWGERRTKDALNCLAGLRGLELADVISTMFITARGRKVSGPTMFAETKENSASISGGLPKMTFASSKSSQPS